MSTNGQKIKTITVYNIVYSAGLSNAAPVMYFFGALINSASFNVNQNFKKKIIFE
jgi:hypothetical protein